MFATGFMSRITPAPWFSSLEQGVVGETYNIGGKNERTNLHIVETICDHLDRLSPREGQPRRALITFVHDRPGHDRRYAIDATKIETELGLARAGVLRNRH